MLELVVVQPQHEGSLTIVKLQRRRDCFGVPAVKLYLATKVHVVGNQDIQGASMKVLVDHLLPLSFFLDD